MLKEIKARYETKCVKCGREIKPNWTMFYEADGKKTFCVPCGKTIGTQPELNQQQNNSDGAKNARELIVTTVLANNELLDAMNKKLDSVYSVLLSLTKPKEKIKKS